MIDAARKGRIGKPLVSYEVVKEVVREYRAGRSHNELVALFGLSPGTVANFVKGKTRFGALAIAEVDGTPYRHPRASTKKLAKWLPLLAPTR